MLKLIRPAVVMLVLFTVLTGGVYPLAVTGLAQIALPVKANGSLIRRDGALVGSVLIGQAFNTDRYFHGRPSATSGPDPKDDSKSVDSPYNAAGSGGSNLGPLSKKLIERVSTDAIALRAATGSQTAPPDALTTSASGLDPHISPSFAALQIARVATARAIPEDLVRRIVQRQTTEPLFRVFGEAHVNVLAVNLQLDAVSSAPAR